MALGQQFGGRPALIANNLPASHAVTNATNATPIVITTGTNHGLSVNDVFSVSGVVGNAAANGTFIAGAVTNTTVSLLAFPAGTNVAGTGAYTSGGTLQALGFGNDLRFPRPADATDGMRAASVNVAFEALGDRTAYLMQFVGPSATTFVRKVGDTMSGDLHMAQGTSIVADGTGATLAGTWTISGNVSCTGGSFQIHEGFAFESDSFVSIVGRCAPRSARVPVADSTTKTLGVAAGSGVDFAGKRFVVAAPSTPRTRTLKSTTVVPSEGETIEVIWLQTVGFGGGIQFTFQREDATVVATFRGATAAEVTVMYCWAEFEFVSGVWRLGATNGMAVDSANALFGVVPGAGA